MRRGKEEVEENGSRTGSRFPCVTKNFLSLAGGNQNTEMQNLASKFVT
jgi:hypothetical protein